MSTLKQFRARLDKAIDKIDANVNTIKQDIAIGVQEALIDVTPVKTGKARTNWRIYLSGEDGNEIPAPTNPDAGAAEAKAEGKATASSSKPKSAIFIINRAAHIGLLNRGWSVQAPANFVRITAQAVADKIAERTKLIVELR